MGRFQNVPVLILAGGKGTRISEETHSRPKPMIEIGELPILLHLMRWYYSFGFSDFVICAGYRAWDIKKFFLDYEFRQNNIVIDHRNSLETQPLPLGRNTLQEKWRVRIIDTGLASMTGCRVARGYDLVAHEKFEHFALTYGDGLSSVDLAAEFAFHCEHKKVGTVLGVHPMARFGELDISENFEVKQFLEKPQSRQGLINGGFFFFKREFRNYLSDHEDCILERAPLAGLAADREMMVFRHEGFWQPMDTLRDKTQLQDLWASGHAPWLPVPK